MPLATGSQATLDFVVQFGKLLSSELSSETGAVLLKVAGIGGIATTDASDDLDGEVDEKAEEFNGLGLVGRPLPSSTFDGRPTHAEVICLRTVDGLTPFAYRDLRLSPPGDFEEGTLAFVGYGGGFHSMSPADPADLEQGTIQVIYVGYDPDANGVPQKAHAITLDPTAGNESISIVHGDGVFLQLISDTGGGLPGAMLAIDSETFARFDADTFHLQCKKIVLQGNVALGANPTTAIALLPPGTPSPSVWVSAV